MGDKIIIKSEEVIIKVKIAGAFEGRRAMVNMGKYRGYWVGLGGS